MMGWSLNDRTSLEGIRVLEASRTGATAGNQGRVLLGLCRRITTSAPQPPVYLLPPAQ
jgi:hypothetical protein